MKDAIESERKTKPLYYTQIMDMCVLTFSTCFCQKSKFHLFNETNTKLEKKTMENELEIYEFLYQWLQNMIKRLNAQCLKDVGDEKLLTKSFIRKRFQFSEVCLRVGMNLLEKATSRDPDGSKKLGT